MRKYPQRIQVKGVEFLTTSHQICSIRYIDAGLVSRLPMAQLS